MLKKYKTSLAMREASRRWRKRHRSRSRLAVTRSNAKYYIKRADLLHLEQLSSLIEKRINLIRKDY